MKDLNDVEIYARCLALFPDRYTSKVVAYPAGDDCLVCGCDEKAADFSVVESGGLMIVFPACEAHMEEMNGTIREHLALDRAKIL